MDKSIGIKLDVRQTGLQQVDDSLAKISKNITTLDDSVSKENTKGWGSSSHTKEMREQLRYLQQIAEVQARIARISAPNGSSSPSVSGQGSLPSRSATHGSGSFSMSRELSQLSSMLGKVGSVIAGVSILGTIANSLGRGDQLSAGYGDINKRMGGARNGGLSYAKDLTRSLDGYGFDDMQSMSATNGYSQVTGRMNPNDLKSQMQAILGTARRFGLSDPSAVTSSFSDAFSSGVSGGSGSQMNPQQFATLVANATVSAHMQGKEAQMLSQLSQVTQMSVQSMGKAGNENTIASFLAMGDRTGNQALIGKLPSMISGINQGIASPSGGYGAQALTMRAIGGGNMPYWKEQYIQSQGAFGTDVDSNGKPIGATNIEKVTNQLMKTYGGDKYKAAMMIGQQFNMTPADAMNYINTYTKDGKFDTKSLNSISGSLPNKVTDVPQTDTDAIRAAQQHKQTGADVGTGLFSAPIRSKISGVVGDVLGSPVGSALSIAGIGGVMANSIYSGYKGIKNLAGFGSSALKTGSPVISETVAGAESVAGAAESSLPSRASRVVSGASKSGLLKRILGPIGEGLMLNEVANIGNSLATKLFNSLPHPKGAKSSAPAVYGPPDLSSTASTASTASTSGAELVPVVISTILALQPYMTQIRSVLGGSDTSSKYVNPTSSMNPSTGHAFGGIPSPSSSGLSLASMKLGGNKGVVPKSASYSKSSGTDAISYYAKLYGVPEYVAYSIAMAESSLNPNDTFAESNGTTSTGLFALNSNGQGSGYSANQLKDPMLNSKIGLGEISKAYKKAKAKGIPEGAGMAQWVAENSGHPGYGVHSQLDDKIRNNAQGILDGKIKIDGGSINVNIKTPDGVVQKVKTPITAEYHGLSA